MITPKLKILFVGESWLGSCARSMKEALMRHAQIVLDEVNEDLYFPKHRAKWLRGVHRLLNKAYKQELYRNVLTRASVFKPDFLVVYKGGVFDVEFVRQLRAQGVRSVNIYPDYSPHAYGELHRSTVGVYDLVISTKPFHSRLWQSLYGYKNACEFVPQGYDPMLHLVPTAPTQQLYDVAIVATWRQEYGDLMLHLAALLSNDDITVAIGGHGWIDRRSEYPEHWVFGGELHGRSYIQWLRQCKICIAPVTREVLINGVRQPGDEDSTRTYELAAAHCFFIHRRTEYVLSLYDESTEVPMYDTAEELAEKIRYYLLHSEERLRLSKKAHQRAVPAYSLDSRADAIVAILQKHLSNSMVQFPLFYVEKDDPDAAS